MLGDKSQYGILLITFIFFNVSNVLLHVSLMSCFDELFNYFWTFLTAMPQSVELQQTQYEPLNWYLRLIPRWCRRTALSGSAELIATFYSASALLAMQSAVLARGILSVCLSVRLSVTFRYCVQTNEDTIVRFSASGRTIPLVSGEVKFILIFAGDHPKRGR